MLEKLKLMKNKVSFDFDATLSRNDVQDFCKEMMELGADVWICTYRTKEYNDELYKIVDKSIPANSDLFEVSDRLGIPRENIIFTEMDFKSNFLNNEFVWHLDDDYEVMYDLRVNSKVPCVNVNFSSYRKKCLRLWKNETSRNSNNKRESKLI